MTCTIPFGKLTAVTGVSGSGKSTLAFDTLYAEGQRRFVDCLSTYARQFLPRLDRPDADLIGAIQPPIALKQQTAIRNARSTVGSITELSDHLQLLFTHAGTVHCARCDTVVRDLRTEEAVAELRALPGEERFVLAAPVDVSGLGEVADTLVREGYSRIFRCGEVVDWKPAQERAQGPLFESPAPDGAGGVAAAPATSGPAAPVASDPVAVVVDRFLPRSLRAPRAAESLETAWKLGHGEAWLFRQGAGDPPTRMLRGLSCPRCGHRADPPTPQLLSPNSSLGACPECHGFGRAITVNRDKVVPDRTKTLRGNAVVPFATASGADLYRILMRRGKKLGVPLDVPFSELTQNQQEWVFAGDEIYPGVDGLFQWLERKRYKAHVRIFLARFRGYVPCPVCRGTRLRPEALSIRLGERTIHDLEHMPVRDLLPFLRGLELSPSRRERVKPVLRETIDRVACMAEAGLEYLTLARTARTLSGGETQRVRLASGLGSALTETLYILDEPTVGLHASDTRRMLGILRRICARGNTAVVVEHDPGIIAGADHLLVLGPSGGEQGGELIYEGPVGAFLQKEPEYFRARSNGQGSDAAEGGVGTIARSLVLTGVREHNLRIDRLEIPLDRLVVVTGVSGSGKSTLVESVLHRNALRHAGKPVEDVGAAERIEGFEQLEEVLLISQDPPGRSSRSTVASAIGILGPVRNALSKTPRARELGLLPGAFSFNVPGGRCETCQGIGTVTIEMQFMNDIEVACEVCRGKRFRDDVLEVTWRGKSILQILDLTVREARAFLASSGPARNGRAAGVDRRTEHLLDAVEAVGLDYLKLGQSTSTLSGGEAQRLRIAELLGEALEASPVDRAADRAADRPTGRAAGRPTGRAAAEHKIRPKLFLFDEPTSGLHPKDIARLLDALRILVRAGHAVVTVEHQLDFIRASDWAIDLGPGGGDAGGRVVYAGPLAGLAACKESVTGRELSG